MSVGILIYIASLSVIYVAERLLDGYEAANIILLVAGAAGFVASIILRSQRMRDTEDPGLRWGHRRMLDFFGLAAVGLVLYVVMRFGLTEDAERVTGVISAVWPALILVATTVLIVLDHALQASPVVLPKQQVARAMWSALSAAFAVALVFPVNYLADRHNERWDFSYFRTADPGSATQNIVAELPQPVDVRIFQPTSSEVLPEIENYFAQIDSPNLHVKVLDQAADPTLARKLRVRDNGYIAFTERSATDDDGDDGDDVKPDRQQPRTHTVKVGTTLDEARVELKNLDQEVQKALLQFARGEVKLYHTVGHGELTFAGSDQNPMRTAKGTKQILEYMNLRPQKLGLTEGLGEGVPEDADVVLVLGPDRGLLAEEVESLRKYLQRGGALLLAIEPTELREGKPAFETEDTLKPLLDDLGVHLGEGVIASESMIVPTSNNLTDRLNVVTDRFSSHPSTVVLSRNRGQLKLFTPGAGHLVERKGAKMKTTVTVRSHSSSWADTNMNLQLDADQAESKSSRPLAIAVEGRGEESFRAVVVADASLFADFPISNPGNQQFIYDSLNWLTGQEALSGEVASEEDVKIQHTKEGQAGWFYTTVVGVPLLFFALGLIRLRLRRRGGDT